MQSFIPAVHFDECEYGAIVVEYNRIKRLYNFKTIFGIKFEYTNYVSYRYTY